MEEKEKNNTEQLKALAIELFQQAYEHQMKGELEEAVALYTRSISLFPTAEAYTFLGWTYSFMGKYGEAIAECHKAIEVDPDFGNPYNDIGAYLIELGKFDEAIPWLEKAIHSKRYDSHCFPHLNLGRIWEEKGDYVKAITSYENALRENPGYALARMSLRKLQAMLN
ncbi:MAG: tetratricopeptide repeat protein [Candidatus Omnitrophica bacterium]|nr:tetratricopeptide repeat protein [Candidatus Omnitrophota bacterium]